MAKKKAEKGAVTQLHVAKNPRIVVTENRDYKVVYAGGVFGGLDPNDARMIFFLDRLKPGIKPTSKGAMSLDRVERELQVEVHMSPHQFLAVAKWMSDHAENFGKRVKARGKEDSTKASYIG